MKLAKILWIPILVTAELLAKTEEPALKWLMSAGSVNVVPTGLDNIVTPRKSALPTLARTMEPVVLDLTDKPTVSVPVDSPDLNARILWTLGSGPNIPSVLLLAELTSTV